MLSITDDDQAVVKFGPAQTWQGSVDNLELKRPIGITDKVTVSFTNHSQRASRINVQNFKHSENRLKFESQQYQRESDEYYSQVKKVFYVISGVIQFQL